MKKILTVLTIAIIFLACSTSNKRNSDFLPPLEITIADEIKGDTELVEVIKSSEKAMNEFSDNIERLVVEGKDVFNKKEEEQSLMDQLTLGKLMVEFVSNSTQMAKLIDEFDNYKRKREEQGLINDAQLKALEQVGIAFQDRITQINTKYESYLN